MLSIKKFVFSPFAENTYLIFNEKNDAVIIDPGCFSKEEEEILNHYITSKELNIRRLLNTHAHIDHVFGNHFVATKYKVDVEMHEKDLITLKQMPAAAEIWGIKGYKESPQPKHFLNEGEQIKIGDDSLDIVFVPGHSPGHIAFISHSHRFVIGGDVLFQGSIGRVDLPGGSLDVLMRSIQNKFLTLADDYVVYSGHGNETTIGQERNTNPFILEYL